MNALQKIQADLKAPKNQRNNFGKYNYRSCEDILEAVKPLLAKHDATLTISDTIKECCGTMYVEATVTISFDDIEVSTTAQAGIDTNRKGMDIAQSFGSSSSYARKYALNGLFCIDDTKDADATNEHGKTATVQTITEKQAADISALAEEVGADIKGFCTFFKIPSISEMPSSQFNQAVSMLEKKRG